MSDARAELLESLLPWGRRPAAGEEEACNALIDASFMIDPDVEDDEEDPHA
ncbi:hypothetical protein ACIPJG_32525 [Streptomyces halstedii]|uniref:hypothetical protein n=1 Tax=Streptomyces halstedii TaxID=1944 RepID=UPI003800D029